MEMRCEVVMEEQMSTTYQTVYEEIKEEKHVPVVKYVPETYYRCVCTTIYQPAATKSCEPVAACPPAAGQPAAAELVPIQVCRKVPEIGYRAVAGEETVQVRRIVAKLVPHPITLCVPKVVWKQVPVQVCCPVPRCCECGCGN
jgi:hypothetical protein